MGKPSNKKIRHAIGEYDGIVDRDGSITVLLEAAKELLELRRDPVTPPDAASIIETGRRHDEAMTPGPWKPQHAPPSPKKSEVYSVDDCHPDYDMRIAITGGDTGPSDHDPINRRDAVPNAAGIAWLRTNLRALLDGYAAALADSKRWERAAMLLRTEASATLTTSSEYQRRHLAALAEIDQLRAAQTAGAKQVRQAVISAVDEAALHPGLGQSSWAGNFTEFVADRVASQLVDEKPATATLDHGGGLEPVLQSITWMRTHLRELLDGYAAMLVEYDQLRTEVGCMADQDARLTEGGIA
jgi:hypothetical protein